MICFNKQYIKYIYDVEIPEPVPLIKITECPVKELLPEFKRKRN